MGETVDAIGYKADVKGRAGEYVRDKKDGVMGGITGARDAITQGADSLVSRVSGGNDGQGGGTGLRERVGERPPSQGDVRGMANQARGSARQNPMAYAFGGVAIGFLLGSMLPSTSVEDERMGDIADDVKDRVKETAGEAVDRGREVVAETRQTAMETAKEGMQQTAEAVKQTVQEQGQQHADELAENAKQQAAELRDTAQERMPSSSGG